MSDLVALRQRGIPFLALVDAVGVAVGGTTTMRQLSARGMSPVCQVNALGVEPNTSAAITTLRSRGVPVFCPVTELGVDAGTGATLAQLRSRGVPPACLVTAIGIAQGGTSTIDQLRARGIGYFCPVDEGGTETSLGAYLSSSGSFAAVENAAEDTVVGTVSLVDPQSAYGAGTYSITAQSNANWFKINATTGVVSVGSSAPDFETNAAPTITVAFSDGVLAPLTHDPFTITVTDVANPTITTSATASVVENATLAISLTSDQTVSWSVVSGADQARFEISSTTLRWASNGTKDFEAPNDANTDNVYVVTVRATNATTGETTDKTISVTVTDVDDTAPTITSANSGSNVGSTVLAFALTANESVTWSKVGGADTAQFAVTGSTLTWVANGTQNFAAPADADTNNTYVVQVRATDGASNTSDQTITITVTDPGASTAGQPIGLLLALTKAA